VILTGDCRAILPTLDAGSVHMVCTSPPYWGLRDYGVAGQLGLEPTPEEYVANMVAVFREVRRVLRDDGTVWLNLGDSYAQSAGRKDADDGREAEFRRRGEDRGYANGSNFANYGGRMGEARSTVVSGLKPKDLVGIRWRVAFALQADGWYLRSDIIWSKPNPMPESVTDRPTKSHEYVFLLSKRERYYFDQEAVREPAQPETAERYRYGYAPAYHELNSDPKGGGFRGEGGRERSGSGRNIRSVWTIATQPYPEAHFATFPEALVVPCIKAGTSERGVCAECGAPRERVVERVSIVERGAARTPTGRADKPYGKVPGSDTRGVPSRDVETTGWRPSCAHDAPTVPATVLDPFGGSGTVGAVAERLSRRAILIELSPAYVELAERRTAQTGLGLTA
jgi:DNA modification methylase